MQAFLDALSPSVREELQRAIDATPDGQQRLREVAEPYFDAQGNWPREQFTADWVARTFIHQASAYYWSDFKPSYGAAGVSGTVVAGVAGAGVSVAVGQGAVILGSQMVERYWADSLAYAAGLDPKLVNGFITAWNRTTALTGWKKLGFAAPEPNVFSQFVDDALGKTLEREIRSQITGLASHVAWRGARSALNHTDRATMGDRVQEVGWSSDYLDRFILNQQQTIRETLRRIVDDGLTRGHSSETIANRLQQTWMLPPRLSQAVDNYRRGLEEQKVPRGRINTFVNRYVEKLKLHRAETLARTESMTLFNLGRDRAWRDAVRRGEMPLDTVKMWVTAKDELVCKVCRPMDGLTVPLGETFLTRDGNIIVPSVHPNCRCMVIPVRNVADFSGAEFVFPVREVVKHLIGQHEQKKHGRKGPLDFVQPHERESHDWTDSLVPAAAMTALALGGFFVLRSPKAFKILPMDATLSDDLLKTATKMNKGVEPNDPHLVGIVADLKGHNDDLLRGFVNNTLNSKEAELVEMVTKGPVLDGPKFRGIGVNSNRVYNSFKTGDEIVLGPTSFTASKQFAQDHFAVVSNPSVRSMTFEVRKARGLEIDTWLKDAHQWEQEALIAGRFRIAEIVDEIHSSGKQIRHVVLEQTGLVAPGSKVSWVTKHLGGPSGKEDHPSGTSQDTHGDGGSSGLVTTFQDKLAQTFTAKEQWSDLRAYEKAGASLVTAYSATGLLVMGAAVAFPATRGMTRAFSNALDLRQLRTPLPAGKAAPLSTTSMPKLHEWKDFTFKVEYAFNAPVKIKRTTAQGTVFETQSPLARAMDNIRTMRLQKAGYQGNPNRLDNLDSRYHGSVVTNPKILGMQHAADEAFDLKAATEHFAKRSPLQKQLDETYQSIGYKPYVEIQSDVMQEMLKRANITEVPVARGMKINATQARAMGLNPVMKTEDLAKGAWQRAEVPLQPLNSFTTDPDVARQFATGITPTGAGNSLALLMRRKVGSDEVFSNFAMGPGSAPWDEWVIKGGTKEWDVVAVNPKLLHNKGFFEELWNVTASTVGKVLDLSGLELAKHLGGPSGSKDHPSGSPQTVHSGESEPFSEKMWDFATYALSRGEVRDRSDLNKTMRKRNSRASRPLRHQRNGKIMDFSVRQLGFMTEGYGFRIGNNNHIRSFANRMMEGQDLFRHEGRRDPILLMVYEDGAQVLDGKHRLAAAQMAGVRKVPVQVARVRKPMPKPDTFRQEWDELRRNLVRYQHANGEIHPDRPSEPFKVRSPYQFEKTFNDWMATRSALRDEERFRELGVERGTKPKRFRRSG